MRASQEPKPSLPPFSPLLKAPERRMEKKQGARERSRTTLLKYDSSVYLEDAKSGAGDDDAKGDGERARKGADGVLDGDKDGSGELDEVGVFSAELYLRQQQEGV